MNLIARCTALAGVYAGAAWIALALAGQGFGTPMWPPTAIAIVGLWRHGRRLWPGVVAGVLLANLGRQPPLALLGIACGNTAEALLAATLLRRSGFDAELQRLRDVFLLAVPVGLGTSAISAAIGVGSVVLCGVVPADHLWSRMAIWWARNMLSVLALSPVLFTWRTPGRHLLHWRMAGPLVALSLLLPSLSTQQAGLPFYLVLPLALWVTVEHGPAGAAWTNVSLTAAITLSAVRSVAPERFFLNPGTLVEHDLFLATLASSTLILAALVAERNAVQRQASASEARLRLLMAQAPLAIWTTDSALGVQSFESGSRHQPTVPPGAPLASLEFADAAVIAAHRRARAGEAAAFEMTLSGRAYECRVQPWKPNPEAQGVLGVGLDVTEQRLVARQLEAVLDALPGNLALVDANARIVRVNRNWIRFGEENGVPAGVVWIGQDYLAACAAGERSGAEGAAEAAQGLRAILAGRATAHEIAYTCHSPGQQRHMRLLIAPLPPEAGCGAVLMHLDVTAARRAQDALRESEDRYRMLVQDLPVGVVVHGPQAEILACNPAACTLFGLSPDELHGRTPAHPAWDAIREDGSSLPAAAHPVSLAIASRRAVRDVLMGVSRPRFGDRVWLLVTADPRLDPDGSVREVTCSCVDVTNQRASEQAVRELNAALEARVADRTLALQASEAQLRAVMEALPGALFQVRVQVDGAAELVFASPALSELFERELDDLRRLVAQRSLAPIVAERDLRDAQRVTLPDPAGWSGDVLIRLPRSNATRWLRIRGQTRADGDALRITGFVVDATAEKRAEARLSMLSRVAEQTGDSVLVADLEGTVVYANPALERFTGLAAASLVGRPAHLAKGLDWGQHARQALDQGRQIDSVTQWRGPHAVCHLEQTITPLRNERGVVTHLVSTSRDITPRVQAEIEERHLRDAIRKAAEEWRATFDGIDMPVMVLDSELNLSRLNLAAQALAREPFEALAGRSLERMADTAFWADMLRLARRACAGETARAEQIEGGDGRVWQAWATPLLRGAQRRQGVILLARDVTSLVVLQQQLRRSETMSAMGRLVAGVAHEVRNPLFAISSLLDAFEDEIGARTGFQEYGRRLRREVERMADLMHDLLEYGRPVEPVLAQDSLVDVLERALRACRPLAASHGVDVHLALDSDLPEVEIDATRLVQVFQNLFENAIQHSIRGGRVVVTASGTPAALECRVADFGPGFRAEDIEHVFDPFYTRRRGGTGLGLAIVQRIVDQHGGSVVAANAPEGVGAVVTVSLPRR